MLPGNRPNAFTAIGNLLDSALLVEILDHLADFAPSKLCHNWLQFRVLLSNDLIESHRHHARILDRVERFKLSNDPHFEE